MAKKSQRGAMMKQLSQIYSSTIPKVLVVNKLPINIITMQSGNDPSLTFMPDMQCHLAGDFDAYYFTTQNDTFTFLYF